MEIERTSIKKYCSCVMAVFKYLFHNCFEDDELQQRNNNNGLLSINDATMIPTMPSSHDMGRASLSLEDGDEEDNNNNNNNNSAISAITTTSALSLSSSSSSQQETSSLFSRLRANFSLHQHSKEVMTRFLPLRTLNSSSDTDSNNSESTQQHLINNRTKKKKVAPDNNSDKCILKEANTFSYDINKEVPTIYSNEFILPGSDIQKNMAMAMKLHMDDQDDECVICMDAFTHDNPRMPTLCGCGENKTFFHLPCLYQWIEENKNCPQCRTVLRWEEF